MARRAAWADPEAIIPPRAFVTTCGTVQDPKSEMSDEAATTCESIEIEDEIRQLVASAAEREGIRVSVEIQRGQVTLRGDAVCQQALGEIASSLFSIAAITQVHTRISAP